MSHLLRHGASVLLCDDTGWSVLDWARHYWPPSHPLTQLLAAAPRTVTEMAGKRYIEREQEVGRHTSKINMQCTCKPKILRDQDVNMPT